MYEKLLDEMEFSFSRLESFDSCKYQFYLDKLEQREGENNAYAELGGLAHEVFADYLLGKLNIDETINKFQDEYDSWVIHEPPIGSMETKYDQLMDYMTSFDESILDKYEILGVEKEVHFKVDKYKFKGFIDLLLRDKETNDLVLLDHKSSKHFLKKNGEVLKNSEALYNKYMKQMMLYSKACYDEYGEYPSKIVWSHFLENQFTVVPFSEDIYVKAIAWAVKTIHAIYEEKNFEAHKDFMGCKMCNHRYTCEYLNDDEEEGD